MKTVNEIKEQAYVYDRLVKYMQAVKDNPAHTHTVGNREFVIVPKEHFDAILNATGQVSFEVFQMINRMEEQLQNKKK